MTAVSITSKDDPMIPDELWMEKFKLWGSMQKGCVAARGPNGIYCAWEGRNCGYSHCPRRIFEEVSIDPDRIPQPKPRKKLVVQIQALQTENDEQKLVIEDLTKRLEALEAK